MKDISVVLTIHREGIIIGPTIKSLDIAMNVAASALGIDIEVVAVLDKSDSLTSQIVHRLLGGRAQIVASSQGDPGQARNCGVAASQGQFIAFLDADDLWSENWLLAAWNSSTRRPDAIWHSHCNITFGKERNLWWHIDSESPLFDPRYLLWANYWDAMSFGARDLYCRFPFRKNELNDGIGHEDWDWNRLTYTAGIAHKSVEGTVHFKRRRKRSQMSLVSDSDCVVWPTKLSVAE